MGKNTFVLGKFRSVAAIIAGTLLPAGALRLALGIFLLITFQALAQNSTRIYVTGLPDDLRINGQGYFMVLDPGTGNDCFTRQGNFWADANGFLVTPTGERLQGSDSLQPGLIFDLNVTRSLWTTAAPDRHWITADGNVHVHCADGSQGVVGQIVLENFASPKSLGPWLNGLWTWPTNGTLSQSSAPGTNGLGILVVGELEQPLPQLHLGSAQTPMTAFGESFLTMTGIPTDLALAGKGYFMVRDTNSNALYATHAGAFYVDGDGYLVNYAKLRLQGYNDEALAQMGDIQIRATYNNMWVGESPTLSFYVSKWGDITVLLADGETRTIGQISLANYPHPEFLISTNFGVSLINTNDQNWSLWLPPGGLFQGGVVAGALELKYVDAAVLAVRQHLNFFQQGYVNATTNGTDLALIIPHNFFVVRDPVGGGSYATRLGAFHLDGANWLVTSNGWRLQGFADSGLTNLGDLRIDTNGAPAAANLNSFSIQSDGKIVALLSNGVAFVRGQILLQRFQDEQSLIPISGGIFYSNVPAARPLLPAGIPGQDGLSRILTGALENLVPPPALNLPPKTGLRVFVTELAGDGILQTSSDLVHWADAQPISGNIAQEAEFFETNATSVSRNFFRIKMN